jgi:hypothetical protein
MPAIGIPPGQEDEDGDDVEVSSASPYYARQMATVRHAWVTATLICVPTLVRSAASRLCTASAQARWRVGMWVAGFCVGGCTEAQRAALACRGAAPSSRSERLFPPSARSFCVLLPCPRSRAPIDALPSPAQTVERAVPPPPLLRESVLCCKLVGFPSRPHLSGDCGAGSAGTALVATAAMTAMMYALPTRAKLWTAETPRLLPPPPPLTRPPFQASGRAHVSRTLRCRACEMVSCCA